LKYEINSDGQEVFAKIDEIKAPLSLKKSISKSEAKQLFFY